MVSSKPLPPIPAPVVEKKDKTKDKDKERRSYLFPSMNTLRRKSEATIPSTMTSPAAQGPQAQAQQNSSPQQPKAQPVDSITSIFSSFLSSAAAFSTLSATKAATTGPKQPSTTSTPTPPETISASTAAPNTTDTLTPPTTTTATDEISPTTVSVVQVKQQAMVTLDQRSLQHLRAIARQSIASSCLEPEILWLRLFMDMIHKLASNAADAWQQVEAAHEAANASYTNANNSPTSATPSNVGMLEKSRETDNVKEKSKESVCKPAFAYSVRLVKHISTTQECSFTSGRFEGESILLEERSIAEQRRPPKEGQTQTLLGGTISLAAGSEDLPKAEKILELLVFALCCLQLEAYLMRDHDVVKSESTRNITMPYEGDFKHNKTPITLNGSKRVSKGSMFFGWISRGTLPAKYKKGTTQLAQDADSNASVQVNGARIADDFGMNEDLQSYQSHRFAKIIQQVEKAVISVSPDITFPPPHLLLRLRDEEAIGPDSKRKSYTWEDVEFVARKIGFGNRINRFNQAGIGQPTRLGSTVCNNQTPSKTTKLPIDSRAGLDYLMTNSNSLQGIFNHQSISFSYSCYWSATAAAPCNPPKLITVEYYRKEGQYEDMGLGEMIEYIGKRAHSNCQDRTCGRKRMEHISTYTHGEARINITVEEPRPDSVTDFDSDEFIPFLSNNRIMAVWARCKTCKARTKPRHLSRASRLYSFGKYLELLLYSQHFEPGPRPLCNHMGVKDAITRCFLYRGLVMSFEYESIDLFEMRISRLQVHENYPTMSRFEPDDTDDRRDFSTSSSSSGPSPRLSLVSMPLNSDYLTESEQADLLNATRLDILHFYESCKKIIVSMEEHLGETKSVSKHPNIKGSKVLSASTVMDPSKKAALDRLDELGDRWKADEFDLYDQLKRVSIHRLNDLRNRFRDSANRTMRSMEAWQKEHHPGSLDTSQKERIEWVLPDYLNSTDYLSLLSSVLHHGNDPTQVEEKAPEPPKKDFDVGGLLVPPRNSLKTSRSDGSVTLVAWKNGNNGSDEGTIDDKAANQGGIDDSEENGDDDGDDSFLVVDGYQTSVKFVQLSKIDFSSLISTGTMSPRSTIGLSFGGSRHGKTPTLGVGSADKINDANEKRPLSMVALPDSTPSLLSSPLATPSEKTQTNSFFAAPPEGRTTGVKPKHTFGYSLTSGFSGTMKGLSLNALSEKIGSGFSTYGASEKDPFVDRAALALEKEVDSASKNLHLKARFSHGKATFSCTVYYAAEFDTLRRRCGIHQTFVQSLSRCNSWNANGGKSKSSFYKTQDDRFVIKQMVSSWNVAEKDELLKFAPKYFEYMTNTHAAPTVLAKIFGFYTLKIKDSTGNALKIDVLVMEHLFYKQKITRTFDLKGIQDRHVGSKPNAGGGGGGSITLWDGDFIEGRFKTLLLLRSHSKKIIRESLLNDTEFLAGANIMDYSLLVGVNDERKELVVGIVDFIGAYTWYKRIESKGKTTLRGAKDNVTVLPPQQYKARFKEAMERYFLAVPDKWSKSVLEQEQEARKEASNVAIPSTVPEGSKETLGTPDLEQTLRKKTSVYLEKMSKVILLSKQPDTPAPTTASPSTIATEKDSKRIEGSGDSEVCVQKLPRVFHPLD
ncbi:hypothetical protein BGZ65_002787 [Modicella reniformis]|uniref:PIPK domain-containing protein n=1 Tax=Modicella reniformis TaxID=1440133 RepID=A0A9P6J0R3_9FUNG|nr:hypothetical protein BGZ65_002787 [Modicella reniformis]